jgi:RalA-binding protein 1
VDLLASDDYWDPHAIAGLLKSYLRELPASLLTHELHSRFLAVMGEYLAAFLIVNSTFIADFVDATDRVRELSDLIAQLPVANYSLLRALTAHLIRIVQNAAVNKMTVRNVGIVFSPTLGIPAGVFSLMLGEFTRVFNVNDAAEAAAASAPENTPEPAPVPERPDTLDRRNSKRYTDNAADQLLGLSGRRLACECPSPRVVGYTTETTIAAEDDEDDEDDDVVDVDDQSIDDTTSEDVTDNLTTSSHATSTSAYTNTAEGSLTIPPYGTSHARTSSDGSRTSKAQYAAQARGLTLSATPSADLRARRGSRMPGASVVGLPSSPRPGHHPSPRGAPSSPAFQTDEPVSPSTPQQHRT